MEVREVLLEDAEKFMDMLLKLDKETKFMLYEEDERKRDMKYITKRIEATIGKPSTLLVAEDNNELVGFCSATVDPLNRIKHIAYLVIGICSKQRGKGIGTKFFDTIELWAKENNIKRLELDVRVDNEIALNLYRKKGFEVEGKKRYSLKVDGKFYDSYYMAKILG